MVAGIKFTDFLVKRKIYKLLIVTARKCFIESAPWGSVAGVRESSRCGVKSKSFSSETFENSVEP